MGADSSQRSGHRHVLSVGGSLHIGGESGLTGDAFQSVPVNAHWQRQAGKGDYIQHHIHGCSKLGGERGGGASGRCFPFALCSGVWALCSEVKGLVNSINSMPVHCQCSALAVHQP